MPPETKPKPKAEARVRGVWVTYAESAVDKDTTVFSAEIEAMRHALNHGQRVVFVAYGQSLREALGETALLGEKD